MIARRVYKVAGPNSLWHHDGWHRLVLFGFVVHAFIDGFLFVLLVLVLCRFLTGRISDAGRNFNRRLVTAMQVSMKNRGDTVFEVFVKGVIDFGCPSRVRGDRGGENTIVAAWMMMTRGAAHWAYIYGECTSRVL